MDVKYINPFLTALKSVLESLGIDNIVRGNIVKKENMHVDMDITSVVGIVGDIRGNVAYSLSQETAKKVCSVMMMGMEVDKMDEIARSAIAELANMVTGTASGIFEKEGKILDITPPSIIFGRDIYFVISSVQTITIDMQTPYGKMEIHIGLEM